MLFVKVLLVLSGGGAVVGVTYSQITKGPGAKTVVVSNNHESKIRTILETQMDKTLLKKQQERLSIRKNTQDTNVKTTEQELEKAKQDLTNANNALNDTKKQLNTFSENIIAKYKTLQAADNSLKNALLASMQHDLIEEEKKLKLEFFNAKKSTIDKEKTSLKTKIEKLKTPTSGTTDICTNYTSWELVSGIKTTEETNIEQSIKDELTALCTAYATVESGISNNVASTDTTKKQAYTDATNTRNTLVNKLHEETQKYNLEITTIKAKEFDVKSKILSFQHKQQSYQSAKENQQKTNNEMEIISEQIQ